MPDDWNLQSIMELSGKYWETATLHTAVVLDLFTILDRSPMNAAALAEVLALDMDATSRLVTALLAMGLLETCETGICPCPAAACHLSRDGDAYMGSIITHHHHLTAPWGRLPEAVRSGRPQAPSPVTDPDLQDAFIKGMANTASITAPRLVPQLDLTDCKRLLDLGGGPASWAIAFARQNPELSATVFDLPSSRAIATKNIEDAGLLERISFSGGNVNEEELPRGFDVVWLSHILHGENPEKAELVLKKAVSALNPGGRILVHEFVLDDTKDGPLFPALFSLNMLVATPDGRSYTQGELMDMMAGAGLFDLMRLDAAPDPRSCVLEGRLPATG